MHDAKILLQQGEHATADLARRGYRLDLDEVSGLLAARNSAISRADDLRAESKRLATQVQAAAKAGGDTTPLKEKARTVKEQIRVSEEEADRLSGDLRDLMLTIPNLPSPKAPAGGEDDAVEVRRVGNVPEFDFTPKDHVDIGESLGILDLERATKLSGPRFSVAKGAGARLERALASFFLDLHTTEHGYTEFSVPHLVNRQTMTGTGQLPKFEEDLFKTGVGSRELYLIPTAEVPLTNLHAGEILDLDALPLAYTAHTPCYRSEAGSYGRDTRGIIRVHQFAKVELVRICAAENSGTELHKMLTHAEECLKRLGLAYRVMLLAAGDMGFSAQITYDIEVWLPSQEKYREISSVSDCGTFQARRENMRMRDRDGRKSFVATLNGSGLPIGRTLAALLEQYQQDDGSVRIPEALVPYTGFSVINADGTTA